MPDSKIIYFLKETRGRFETAEKVVFHKKTKNFGVLKCIIQQERGLRSDSRGPFFYDYIGVLKKVDFFSGFGRFYILIISQIYFSLIPPLTSHFCSIYGRESILWNGDTNDTEFLLVD